MWDYLPEITDLPDGIQLRHVENRCLVNGVLTINHGKGTKIVIPVAFFDPDGIQQLTSGLYSVVDDKLGSIDFGGNLSAGKWLLILQFIYL